MSGTDGGLDLEKLKFCGFSNVFGIVGFINYFRDKSNNAKNTREFNMSHVFQVYVTYDGWDFKHEEFLEFSNV
jgi:hypothetical protein